MALSTDRLFDVESMARDMQRSMSTMEANFESLTEGITRRERKRRQRDHEQHMEYISEQMSALEEVYSVTQDSLSDMEREMTRTFLDNRRRDLRTYDVAYRRSVRENTRSTSAFMDTIRESVDELTRMPNMMDIYNSSKLTDLTNAVTGDIDNMVGSFSEMRKTLDLDKKDMDKLKVDLREKSTDISKKYDGGMSRTDLYTGVSTAVKDFGIKDNKLALEIGETYAKFDKVLDISPESFKPLQQFVREYSLPKETLDNLGDSMRAIETKYNVNSDKLLGSMDNWYNDIGKKSKGNVIKSEKMTKDLTVSMSLAEDSFVSSEWMSNAMKQVKEGDYSTFSGTQVNIASLQKAINSGDYSKSAETILTGMAKTMNQYENNPIMKKKMQEKWSLEGSDSDSLVAAYKKDNSHWKTQRDDMLKELEKADGKLTDSLKTVTSKSERVKNKIGLTKAGSIIGETMDTIKNDSVLGGFTASLLGNVGGGVLRSFGGKLLGKIGLGGATQTATSTLTGTGAQVAGTGATQAVTTGATGGLSGIASSIGTALPMTLAVTASLASVGTNVKSAYGDFKNMLKTKDKDKKKEYGLSFGAKGIIQTLGSVALGPLWAGIVGKVFGGKIGKKIKQGLDYIDDKWEKLKSGLSNTWKDVSSTIKDKWSDLKEWGSGKFASIKEGIGDFLSKGFGKLQGLLGKGKEKINKARETTGKVMRFAGEKFASTKTGKKVLNSDLVQSLKEDSVVKAGVSFLNKVTRGSLLETEEMKKEQEKKLGKLKANEEFKQSKKKSKKKSKSSSSSSDDSDSLDLDTDLFEDMADGSHRTGLDNVPFDGYKAILHKDEAVLTKQQAENWRKEESAKTSLSWVQNSIKEAMQRAKENLMNRGSGGSSSGGKQTITKFTGDQADFVKKILPGTLKAYKAYKILPSLTLSQAALESGWGKAAIGNNIFGIKAGEDWKGKKQYVATTEYVNGRYEKTKAWFRDYNSIDESILDHGKVLATSNYDKVRAAKNYKEAAIAVHKAGYATDPNYPNKLIGMIEHNKFNAYDNISYLQKKVKEKLPAYAEGNDRVQQDQVALIHKDEMIVPAKNNPLSAGKKLPLNSSNTELIDVMKWGFEYLAKKIEESSSKGEGEKGKEIKLVPKKVFKFE